MNWILIKTTCIYLYGQEYIFVYMCDGMDVLKVAVVVADEKDCF